MNVYYANPIYDVVFKYLMEDERIAKILISALLKKDIVKLEMRPHEYSNAIEGRVRIFRIDFAATIREENGEEHLVLVELQKTWRPTETLRFRQYLGIQYGNPKNVTTQNDGAALPIVSIYLLGHKVGDLKEPVIYVKRRYLDYDSNEIHEGVPDKFIESLTHDSIIVQIPYLKGKARNHLEKLLSFFDQSAVTDNPHVLQIEEGMTSDNDDMERILNRLVRAIADPIVSHNMNIEDEILSELEKMDTDIYAQKKKLAEQEQKLGEQELRLGEQEQKLGEQEQKLGEQEQKLGEQELRLGEQEQSLKLAVKLFVQNGLDAEQIASALGLSVEKVQEYMK